jgi:hypothetical protein
MAAIVTSNTLNSDAATPKHREQIHRSSTAPRPDVAHGGVMDLWFEVLRQPCSDVVERHRRVATSAPTGNGLATIAVNARLSVSDDQRDSATIAAHRAGEQSPRGMTCSQATIGDAPARRAAPPQGAPDEGDDRRRDRTYWRVVRGDVRPLDRRGR